MWHGVNARFHEGTVVHLEGLQDKIYSGKSCEVLRFEPDKKRWAVRLSDAPCQGKELLVREECLQLSYCILPCYASDLRGDELIMEQLSPCGRGLIFRSTCAVGEVVFEEHPFLVSATTSPSAPSGLLDRSHPSLLRWIAYLQMQRGARSTAANASALRSFEGLTSGSNLTNRVRDTQEDADAILASINGDSPGQSEKAWLRDAISQVLLVWQANQFEFQNGPDRKASALFSRGCLLNHSCSPTVTTKCQWSQPTRCGMQVPEDGRLVVQAARKLEPGDVLTQNYGPKALLCWDLSQRREYLLRVHSFHCCCLRCAAEELQAGDTAPSGYLMSMD
mmetsp:Transcript_19871/g.42353  ORF Transcript_19871/g.42353 Transcript_19871/m.42353 type:complete len:335 (-) Transcript_19871:106-1110(-)